MTHLVRFVALLVGLVTGSAHAASLEGTWQGVIDKQQHVLKITKARDGSLQGDYYNLGFDPAAHPTETIGVHGQTIRFTLADEPRNFVGVIAQDGKSISGTCEAPGTSKPFVLTRANRKTAWVIDGSPHKVQMVPVERDVSLEVLDWGGEGSPVVFLTGLIDTAHVFDNFAPKFTGKHHVYAITRRGFGASSSPPPTDDNYDANRLGDDVLAVIDALKLHRPVLVGHSIAGSELSSVGTRYPEKVAGLIYLDATNDYAFYSPNAHSGNVDIAVMRRDLGELFLAGGRPSMARATINEIRETIPRLNANLDFLTGFIEGRSELPELPRSKRNLVIQAIVHNERKYRDIRSPALAIIAVPIQCEPNCESPQAKGNEEYASAQANAVEAEMKSARVVRLPYANHAVYRSNEADVLREMNAFMDGLDSSKH